MNSDQERVLFEQYGWDYDYIGRLWIAPDGTKLSPEDLMEITVDTEGDLALMRLIVERGTRKV